MSNNNNNIPTREQIYLAALLHDIGKFLQRADDKEIDESNILKSHVKNNKNNLSNITQDGFVTHGHTLYTQQFFEDNKSIIDGFDNKSTDNNITNLSSYHHKPATFYQELIQLADWWSSGMDRNKAYENQGYDKDYKKRPLISVFKHLHVSTDSKNSECNCFYNLHALSLEKEKIFPVCNNHSVDQPAYAELWKSFIEELKNVPYLDFRIFSDTLYYLLQKYLWCIPASTLTDEIHDSNLFEHSKTTAAIALCLYDYCKEHNINEISKLNNECRPVLLVCIDISGIQNFIYNISMKGAAKALKARSFYLQLLMDTIINEILYELGYYRSNVLYSSGGKAYLLLPNIKKVNDCLNEYQKKLDEWLYKKFNGELYVSIGKVSFYFDKDAQDSNGKKYLIDNKNNNTFIGELWSHVLEEASKKKNQRFRSVIENENNKNFFEPFGSGGQTEICDLTGIEINSNKKYTIENCTFSESVGEQIELGKILKHTKFFVWKKIKDPIIYANALYSLEILDSYWYFFDANQHKPKSVDDGIVYKAIFENFDFLQNTIPGKSVKAFRFYAGTTEINEFADLLNKNSDFKRLSALVMDVDNLGKIFVNGFKEFDNNGNTIKDNSTFSRLATLSFYLDLFFSGYINVIKNKYQSNVLVVYSGGDDLLAVGNWNEILRFAEDIKNEFYEFVCKRPEISVSAGVSMFTEKFPISKAVDMAKEAEAMAKKWNNEQKGNICLLGEVVSWRNDRDEFRKINNIKENLIKFYNTQLITSSFIQRFQTIYEVKKAGDKVGDLSYRWNTAYYLKRYEKRVASKATSEFNIFMGNIYNDLQVFLTNAQIHLFTISRNYELYAIAARLAELELRSKNTTKWQELKIT